MKSMFYNCQSLTTLDVSDLGIDFVCGIQGIAINKDKSSAQSFPCHNGTSYIACHYKNGIITVTTNNDWSAYHCRVTIDYVKKQS